jgi:homoserine O-succinyltransferase
VATRQIPGPLRVGIINIMPKAESYEGYLTRPLSRWPGVLELSWIRLESHSYSSSDQQHIARAYRTFGQVTAKAPLDGLILTGAPVEELAYEAVTYWPELTQILVEARRVIPSTLGLCWGGMALGKLLGIEKQPLPHKLFGVFANRTLDRERGLLAGGEERFWCAQSRHSGLADETLEWARNAGDMRLLAHGDDTGYSIFETPDGRYVAHLGHPEYEPSRLVEEWRRDASLGRTDVGVPRNLDLAAPVDTWRSHRTGFFARWLTRLAEAETRTRDQRTRTHTPTWNEEEIDESSAARSSEGQ